MSGPSDRERLRGLLLEAVIAAGPVSTRELTGTLPARQVVVNVPCSAACQRTNTWSATETVVEHHSRWHRISGPLGVADIYRPLRALEQAGLIRRCRAGRDALWMAPEVACAGGGPAAGVRRVQTRRATKGRL